MGALRRATVAEVESLHAGDASWWPGLCGEIAEKGAGAIEAEKALRCWSWSGLWQWIKGDETRYREYSQALEAYVQMKALETIGISDSGDDPADKKVRIDTRFRLAGKVDRVRWGEKVEHTGTVAVVDAGLVEFAGALLGRVRALPERSERVINEVPVRATAEVVQADEI